MKRLLTVKLLSLCAVLSVEAQSDVWRSDSLQEVLKLGVPLLQDAETDVELVAKELNTLSAPAERCARSDGGHHL